MTKFRIGDKVTWTASSNSEGQAQHQFGRDGWVVMALPGVMQAGRLQGKRCVLLTPASTIGQPSIITGSRWVQVDSVRVVS